MPYQREKFSLWWIFLWTVIFFGGMILIFSFLLGNPFFSGKITGKYVFSTSSENAALFMDNEFLGIGRAEGNIPLGKKTLCAEEHFFITRCFHEEIRSNAFTIVEQKGITLFPRNLKTDILTNSKVYFDPAGSGLFWIDFEKNVIWGIKKEENQFFSTRIPPEISEENFAVEYNNSEKKFVITQKAADTKLKRAKNLEISEKKIFTEIVFPENFINFSLFSDVKKSLLAKDETLEFLPSSFLLKKNKNKNEEGELLASFSEPAQKIYTYEKNKIIEFPYSVWIFAPEDYSFQKLFSKQPKTRIFWHKKTSSIFFQEDDALRRMYLK